MLFTVRLLFSAPQFASLYTEDEEVNVMGVRFDARPDNCQLQSTLPFTSSTSPPPATLCAPLCHFSFAICTTIRIDKFSIYMCIFEKAKSTTNDQKCSKLHIQCAIWIAVVASTLCRTPYCHREPDDICMFRGKMEELDEKNKHKTRFM